MSIVTADLVLRRTIKTGVAGNAAAQPDPNQSLGKFASTTALVDAALNDLWDDISGDENALSTVDYRAVAILNTHATLALLIPKIWLPAEVAGGASVAIGLDPVGVVAAAAIMGTSIATELDAPAGVVFSAPTTKTAGLAPANIPAGSGLIVWIRRTSSNTAAVDLDGYTLRIEGDTAA